MGKDKFTILVVEDDPNDVYLLKRAFEAAQITDPITVLNDGAEAIAYLSNASNFQDRENSPYPGLIILDLKMPRKSGMEVLIWLKNHPELFVIPVIVFTSSSQTIDIKLSYGHGANSYIVKPSGLEALKKLVKTIYDYWNVCQRLPPVEPGSE